MRGTPAEQAKIITHASPTSCSCWAVQHEDGAEGVHLAQKRSRSRYAWKMTCCVGTESWNSALVENPGSWPSCGGFWPIKPAQHSDLEQARWTPSALCASYCGVVTHITQSYRGTTGIFDLQGCPCGWLLETGFCINAGISQQSAATVWQSMLFISAVSQWFWLISVC